MKSIPKSAVSSWHFGGLAHYPTSININCPQCGRLANFRLTENTYDASKQTSSATARCPACSERILVFAVSPSKSVGDCEDLCVHPDPITVRQPIIPSGHLPEPALERTYYAAIRAYNVGLWDACAMSCRKTLEGIVHTLNPNAKGSLFEQLKDVFQSANLTEPLVHVSDVIRKGGNIGAHFDLDREPDQEVARIMVDLLDFFLEFTFMLKDRAGALEARLAALAKPKG